MVDNLWRNRNLIWQLIRRELSQRYRASYLGVLWSLLTPTLLLLIYTFVFSVVLKTKWTVAKETQPHEFALIIFAGLAAFNVFSEVVGRAPSLVLTVPNYVKKVVFPLEILPVAVLGSALINSLIIVSLVIMGNMLISRFVSQTLYLLPLVYLPLLLLSAGLAWFLSSLGMYIRDVGQGIGLVVQMLFFLSGVFFPAATVPEQFRPVVLLNPLTAILTNFRQILLWGEMPDWTMWGWWMFGSALVAWAGYTWFMKTKKGFADVL